MLYKTLAQIAKTTSDKFIEEQAEAAKKFVVDFMNTDDGKDLFDDFMLIINRAASHGDYSVRINKVSLCNRVLSSRIGIENIDEKFIRRQAVTYLQGLMVDNGFSVSDGDNDSDVVEVSWKD